MTHNPECSEALALYTVHAREVAAEIDQLRAELAEMTATMWALAGKVARVRELCDDVPTHMISDDIRAAILHELDGGTE